MLTAVTAIYRYALQRACVTSSHTRASASIMAASTSTLQRQSAVNECNANDSGCTAILAPAMYVNQSSSRESIID
eukprot:10574-Heterococcus_DN1.PRE.2